MKKKIEELPKTVVEIGEINWHDLDVNVIPNSWYQYIKKSKKPNRLAIEILAEIVYWYRPSPVRDEITMKTIGYRKKFKSDAWQVSYAKLEAKFGASRRETKGAVDLLVGMELVKRTFRNFVTDEGLHLSNVMYLEPIAKNVRAITLERTPSYVSTYDPLRSNDTPSYAGSKDVYRDSYKDSTKTKKREEEETPPSSSQPFDSTDKTILEKLKESNYLSVFKLDKIQASDLKQIDKNADKVKLLIETGFERVLQFFEEAKRVKKEKNNTWKEPDGTGISTILNYPGIGRYVFNKIYFEKLKTDTPVIFKKYYFDPIDLSDLDDDGYGYRTHASPEFENYLQVKGFELRDFVRKEWEFQYYFCREFLAWLPKKETAQEAEQ